MNSNKTCIYPDRTLLLVDLQNGFAPSQRLVDSIKLLIPKYGDVLFTRFINPGKTGPFCKQLDWNNFQDPDHWETQLVIDPQEVPNSRSLIKHSYGLFEHQVRQVLAFDAIKQVDICGLDFGACVLACAFDLFDSGVKVKVLSHACQASNVEEFDVLEKLSKLNFS